MKEFLKPTKIKIGLTIIIFIGTLFLIPILDGDSILQKIFYCLFFPDGCAQRTCLYKMQGLCSFYKTIAFDLFYIGSAQNIQNLSFNEIQDLEVISSFFLFPLRIIYYYFIVCVLIYILILIKK